MRDTVWCMCVCDSLLALFTSGNTRGRRVGTRRSLSSLAARMSSILASLVVASVTTPAWMGEQMATVSGRSNRGRGRTHRSLTATQNAVMARGDRSFRVCLSWMKRQSTETVSAGWRERERERKREEGERKRERERGV